MGLAKPAFTGQAKSLIVDNVIYCYRSAHGLRTLLVLRVESFKVTVSFRRERRAECPRLHQGKDGRLAPGRPVGR